MWRTVVYMLVIIALPVREINGGNITDIENLFRNLFRNYSSFIRPHGQHTDLTSVYMAMYPISVNEMDEISGTMSVFAFFTIQWRDWRITWNPTNYRNIYEISVPQGRVWTPELALFNPTQKITQIGLRNIMIRFSDSGNAEWIIGEYLDTSCDFDITHFPFDRQTCSVQFMPWSYKNYEMTLVPRTSDVNTDYYTENEQWNLKGTSVETSTSGVYDVISFSFELERRPQFFIVSLFFPVVVLVLLNALVFVIPSDSGERIGYSVTCLLAIAVFLTLLSDNLPKTSNPISVVTVVLMICLLISTSICVLTIISLRIHHKDSSEPVHDKVKKVVRKMKEFSFKKLNCFANKPVEVKPILKDNVTVFDLTKDTSDKGEAKLRLPPEDKVSRDIELDKQDIEITWRVVAKLFDKVCFCTILICTGVLGVLYFMVASGRL